MASQNCDLIPANPFDDIFPPDPFIDADSSNSGVLASSLCLLDTNAKTVTKKNQNSFTETKPKLNIKVSDCEKTNRNFTLIRDSHFSLVNSLFQQGIISKKRAFHIMACGKGLPDFEMFFVNTKTGRFHFGDLPCNSSLCPRCNALKRKKFFSSYLPLLMNFKYPKMLTITFRAVSELTKGYVTECSYYAHRFQEILSAKNHPILMGVRVKEVKFHHKDEIKRDRSTRKPLGRYESDSWMIHYHYIIGGDSIPYLEVSKALEQASCGKSKIAHICSVRRYGNVKKSLRYVLKYLGKIPENLSVGTSIQYFKCFNGTHFFDPVGLWVKPDSQGFSLLDKWRYLLFKPSDFVLVKCGNYENPDYWDFFKYLQVSPLLSIKENIILYNPNPDPPENEKKQPNLWNFTLSEK